MINDPIEPYPAAWNQTRPANAPARRCPVCNLPVHIVGLDQARIETTSGAYRTFVPGRIASATLSCGHTLDGEQAAVWLDSAGKAPSADADSRTGHGADAGTPETAETLSGLIPVRSEAAAAVLDKLAAMTAERDDLHRKVEAVRALHHERVEEAADGYRVVFEFCAYDDEVWPCPTVRALDGEEADRADR